MKENTLREKIKTKKVIIVIHEHTLGGPEHNLKNFFLKNSVQDLIFIAHPLLYMKQGYQKSSRYELYTDGKLIFKKTGIHWKLPESLLYVKDVLYTIFWSIQQRKKGDLFVGSNPLNALSGLILKRLGYVRKVIYYSIDYFPTRFENRLLNWIYHFVDKIAVRFADETWNVGARMAKARRRYNNMKGDAYKRQFVVPIGVWLSKAKRKPFDKTNKKKLIYAGHLISYMGVDLPIRALPEILKIIPDVQLEIIGRGEAEKELKDLVRHLKLENHVIFFKWMEDRRQFESHLSDGAIGLAPFNTNILDDKVKNADPGKIKDYMLVGLPVITTKAVFNYKQIEKSRCGIVIDYKIKELTNAVVKLLKNQSLLKEYRENAIDYVSQFDWGNIFASNLRRVLD